MWKHVGNKMKNFSKVYLVLSLISDGFLGVLLIVGFYKLYEFMYLSMDYHSFIEWVILWIAGLTVLIIAVLMHFLLSYLLYGFGQLVEDVKIIKESCDNRHEDRIVEQETHDIEEMLPKI